MSKVIPSPLEATRPTKVVCEPLFLIVFGCTNFNGAFSGGG